MDNFRDLMYDLILESLCNYVESDELDIDEAEILSESAYNEIFESRRITREMSKYYNKRTNRFNDDAPDWLMRNDDISSSHGYMLTRSFVNKGDKKNAEDIRNRREVFDRIVNRKNQKMTPSPERRARQKFRQKQIEKREKELGLDFKKGVRSNYSSLVKGITPKNSMSIDEYNRRREESRDKVNKIKNKIDIRKKIPALLNGIISH